jgi:hypothetical protein
MGLPCAVDDMLTVAARTAVSAAAAVLHFMSTPSFVPSLAENDSRSDRMHDLGMLSGPARVIEAPARTPTRCAFRGSGGR